MVNPLNEEIRCITQTKGYLKRAIALECDSGRKQQLKNDLDELDRILKSKLNRTGDI